MSDADFDGRVAALPWESLHESLDTAGFARTGPFLKDEECDALLVLAGQPERFRKRVVMERHRYGKGVYSYFSNPLIREPGDGFHPSYFAAPIPPSVEALRRAFYPPLAALANRWAKALGEANRYPPTHGGFLRRCRSAGQTRPTPLVLHYERGGFNCLHQDVYGPVHFPLQVVAMLRRPGRDFRGGEFLLVEQRARQQSRGRALQLERGEVLIFTGGARPVAGARGPVRATLRHGVSEVEDGVRDTLGIIFHDAK